MDRVLILNDEPGMLEVLDFFLSSHGFRVATARSLPEVVLSASERPPDVVLCDLDRADELPAANLSRALDGLPQLDGVPVVALSLERPPASAQRFGEWVAKPFAPARVAEALRRVLRSSRRQARHAG